MSETPHLDALLSASDVDALRAGKPIEKGKTRLAERTDAIRDEKIAEKAWRKACIARDGRVCRHCKRKVVQQLALAPERLEVHHIAGRADQAVRWDVRNGVVLCCGCHEQVTRHALLLVQAAKHLFRIGQKTYINANKKIDFKRNAA